MPSIGQRRKWLRGAGIALVSAVAALGAQQLKLYPVDEAASDRSFLAFRAQLRKAVEARDATFIRTIVSPDIELTSGGERQGPEQFEEEWQPDNPDSELWGTLDDVLSLGGSFTNGGRQFWAPYVYSKWPEQLDAGEYLVVVGKRVKLRSSCSVTAPVVALLDYDIVTWNNPKHESITKGDKEWVQVKTSAGKKGCVLDDYVRSPLDYRACFEKIRGKWMMTSLLAGE